MPKDPVLDQVMIQLSDLDALSFRNCIEGGVLITGGLGSGKSSTSARTLALAFLRSGKGGLVLTVKSDETEHWRDYARLTGREADLVIFNAESGLCFDFVKYAWDSGGRSAGQIETVVELLTTLTSIGKPQGQSDSGRYFENAVEELLRAVLVLLSNAGEPISIPSLHRVVSSLPTFREQVENEEWQQTSPCGRLVNQLRERKDSFSPSQWEDLEVAVIFLMEKWPELDTRTRSNIESTWSGMASKFTYDPCRSMFCAGRVDFTPEQCTHKHLIAVVDMPTLEYGKAASKLCQVGLKTVFQRAWLRHPYKPGCCHGAFLFEDEFAQVMSRDEQSFHMVCRGSAIAPICILPNILNMAAEEFGEQTPGSRTLGFLGLLAIKIFHANNETRTNEYASEQIGKEFRYISGWNAGSSEATSHTGVSGTMQQQYVLEPVELSRLHKPSGEDPLSEAVVTPQAASSMLRALPAAPTGRAISECFFRGSKPAHEVVIQEASCLIRKAVSRVR